MSASTAVSFICPLCQGEHPVSEGIDGELVLPQAVAKIGQEHPAWAGDRICQNCHNRYYTAHLRERIEAEIGDLSALEERVIETLREQTLLSRNLNDAFDQHLTPGERLADRVAHLAGSWPFVAVIIALIVTLFITNIVFDLPAPFGLHSLVCLSILLGCLAATQGPIILMSQNRQKRRERMAAEQDYQINLKAELELRYLTAKLELLLARQWQRLAEIQVAQQKLTAQLDHQHPTP